MEEKLKCVIEAQADFRYHFQEVAIKTGGLTYFLYPQSRLQVDV